MKIDSTAGMRKFLIDQMQLVAEGKQDQGSAKAVANYAQQIYNTINMELKVAQAKAKFGSDVAIKSVEFK